jgi:hypothetical protein
MHGSGVCRPRDPGRELSGLGCTWPPARGLLAAAMRLLLRGCCTAGKVRSRSLDDTDGNACPRAAPDAPPTGGVVRCVRGVASGVPWLPAMVSAAWQIGGWVKYGASGQTVGARWGGPRRQSAHCPPPPNCFDDALCMHVTLMARSLNSSDMCSKGSKRRSCRGGWRKVACRERHERARTQRARGWTHLLRGDVRPFERRACGPAPRVLLVPRVLRRRLLAPKRLLHEHLVRHEVRHEATLLQHGKNRNASYEHTVRGEWPIKKKGHCFTSRSLHVGMWLRMNHGCSRSCCKVWAVPP